MSARRELVLAWFLWSAGVAALGLALVFATLNATEIRWSSSLASSVTAGSAFVAIGLVGLVVATRRPANAIGWIYLGCWLVMTVQVLMAAYGRWATVTTPGNTAGSAAVWVSNWLWSVVMASLLTFPILLFPDGHLPSRRWRTVAWISGVTVVLWPLSVAFSGADYTDAFGEPTPNPYSPAGLVAVCDVAKNLLAFVFLLMVACSVASLVVRFRKGSPLERAQVKWLALAAALTGLFAARPGSQGVGSWPDAAFGLVLALIPLSVGVAILRYRLYDIDRIISRTAAYLIVSGAVLATYVAVVWAASQLLGETSSLAVAAATLAAAAAFRPLLRRVQHAVDRRFNRARYDADHIALEFGTRLRDEVDPVHLSADLLATVGRTVQPTSLALWLRQGSP